MLLFLVYCCHNLKVYVLIATNKPRQRTVKDRGGLFIVLSSQFAICTPFRISLFKFSLNINFWDIKERDMTYVFLNSNITMKSV